jgi:hypothetical protein
VWPFRYSHQQKLDDERRGESWRSHRISLARDRCTLCTGLHLGAGHLAVVRVSLGTSDCKPPHGTVPKVKPNGRLVPVSSARRRASTPGLLTSSSTTDLQGILILWLASRLDAFSGYPFQTWLPGDALGKTTGTPGVCPSRSSRTRDSSTSRFLRPRQIGTKLSHDVLNPARVPL